MWLPETLQRLQLCVCVDQLEPAEGATTKTMMLCEPVVHWAGSRSPTEVSHTRLSDGWCWSYAAQPMKKSSVWMSSYGEIKNTDTSLGSMLCINHRVIISAKTFFTVSQKASLVMLFITVRTHIFHISQVENRSKQLKLKQTSNRCRGVQVKCQTLKMT